MRGAGVYRMADLLNGAQKALFQRLSTASTLTGVSIVEHAEQNKPAPFVLIESLSAEDAGGKAGGLDLLQISLLCEARNKGRKDAQALMDKVRDALDGWTPSPVDNVRLSAPKFRSSDVFRLDEADRYFGQMRFQAFVQAA